MLYEELVFVRLPCSSTHRVASREFPCSNLNWERNALLWDRRQPSGIKFAKGFTMNRRCSSIENLCMKNSVSDDTISFSTAEVSRSPLVSNILVMFRATSFWAMQQHSTLQIIPVSSSVICSFIAAVQPLASSGAPGSARNFDLAFDVNLSSIDVKNGCWVWLNEVLIPREDSEDVS